ncbi:MAG TPA: M48 family metalloprotease, partial [Stenomitos sp.]
LPYEFHVITSSELNAFALPGGQIFVTTAALKAMKNEAELGGVLAHEVTHVAHKHGIDQLRRAMLAQGIAIAALGSTPAIAQQAGKIALELVLKGFSRTAEDEADRYGARFTSAAGYDPHGLSSFLQTLAQTMGDTPKAFEPLSDHPIISERVQHITETISEWQLTGTEVSAQTFLNQTQPLR